MPSHASVKASMIQCTIAHRHLTLGLKGLPPFLDVREMRVERKRVVKRRGENDSCLDANDNCRRSLTSLIDLCGPVTFRRTPRGQSRRRRAAGQWVRGVVRCALYCLIARTHCGAQTQNAESPSAIHWIHQPPTPPPPNRGRRAAHHPSKNEQGRGLAQRPRGRPIGTSKNESTHGATPPVDPSQCVCVSCSLNPHALRTPPSHRWTPSPARR